MHKYKILVCVYLLILFVLTGTLAYYRHTSMGGNFSSLSPDTQFAIGVGVPFLAKLCKFGITGAYNAAWNQDAEVWIANDESTDLYDWLPS